VTLWMGRQPALTVGLATGNRNMGLVLVALADRGDPAILFFFAMAQFPMYMLPALLAPLYRALTSAKAEAAAPKAEGPKAEGRD
jgi:hypothetical protein